MLIIQLFIRTAKYWEISTKWETTNVMKECVQNYDPDPWFRPHISGSWNWYFRKYRAYIELLQQLLQCIQQGPQHYAVLSQPFYSTKNNKHGFSSGSYPPFFCLCRHYRARKTFPTMNCYVMSYRLGILYLSFLKFCNRCVQTACISITFFKQIIEFLHAPF